MTPLHQILATCEPGSNLARVTNFRHRAALLRHMNCSAVSPETVRCFWLEDVTDPRQPDSMASIRVHYTASGSSFCRYFHPDALNKLLVENPVKEEVEQLLPLDRSTSLLNLCLRKNPSEEEREVVCSFAHEKDLIYHDDPYETVVKNVLEYLRSGLACVTQVKTNRRVVWVNAGNGLCVGRFSQRGVDVPPEQQADADPERFDSTYGRPTPADWDRFVIAMRKIGADVTKYRPTWLG